MSDINENFAKLTFEEVADLIKTKGSETDEDFLNMINNLKENFLQKEFDEAIELDEESSSKSTIEMDQFKLNQDLVNLLKMYRESDEMDCDSESLDSFAREKLRLEIVDKIKALNQNSSELSEDDEELPKNLIVTSIPSEVFSNLEVKAEFERLFASVDSRCKFCYFRIFKRCLVQFDSEISAVLVRYELNGFRFLDERIRVFLTRPIRLKNTRPFLEPPRNEKTFLISPPSSPPVDWEQVLEDPPVVNLDLLAALSKLNPHEPCELIKSNNEIPGIVIHPCADMIFENADSSNKLKYIPTRRPANDMS